MDFGNPLPIERTTCEIQAGRLAICAGLLQVASLSTLGYLTIIASGREFADIRMSKP